MSNLGVALFLLIFCGPWLVASVFKAARPSARMRARRVSGATSGRCHRSPSPFEFVALGMLARDRLTWSAKSERLASGDRGGASPGSAPDPRCS